MDAELKTMVVAQIEHDEDRTLLYESPNIRRNYYVIAKKNSSVKVGDVITYEPYGVNFGFHREDVQP